MKVCLLVASLIVSFIGLGQEGSGYETIIFPSTVTIENLTKQQEENLAILCKVWGYAKYKHPDIANGSIDWDKELLSLLELYKSKHFQEELFNSLPKMYDEIRLDSLAIIEYPNWVDSLRSENLKAYTRNLAHIPIEEIQNYIEPGKWNITPKFKENIYEYGSWNDDGIRLLTIFRYWNIIEYFYPYKSIMSVDWDTILKEYIAKVLNTSTELEYKLCILELVSEINDGHAGIHGDKLLTNYFGENQLPIQVKLIEGKVYVTDIFDEFKNELDMKPGDILLRINDTSVKSMLLAKRKYISASTKASSNRKLSELVIRTNSTEAKVTLERNSHIKEINSPTIKYNTIKYVQKNIDPYREISEDIGYIYPGSLTNEKIDSVLNLVKNKRSIILDYRSYPLGNLQTKLPTFLLPYPKYAFQGDHYNLNPIGKFYRQKPYKWGSINNDYYKGNLLILVNEYTQSQPEFEILIYQQAPNTVVIGSSTAGTIGNWTPIKLPLNILTSMSGNGIYGLNNQQIQRVGIIPDIYVEQSLEGIVKAKDEILLKAIEYCNKL